MSFKFNCFSVFPMIRDHGIPLVVHGYYIKDHTLKGTVRPKIKNTVFFLHLVLFISLDSFGASFGDISHRDFLAFSQI